MKARPSMLALLLLAGVLGLGTLLTICSGPGCGLDEQAADGRIILEFWTISLHPTYDDYIQDLVKGFEATHPQVKLEWVDVPIDVVMQKLMASIAGGVPPDLVNLNSTYAMVLAQNNALVNMDQEVSAADRERYFPGLWRAAYYEGSNYAIPWYVSTPVLMYNRDIFRRAGLADRPAPSTWEEIGEYSRIIRQRTGLYGFMPYVKEVNKMLDEWQVMGVQVMSPDGRQATFNTPQAAGLLQFYADLYQGDFIPPETMTQGYQGAVDRYKSGSMGMLLAGPQFLLRIRKDAPGIYAHTTVAPYPQSVTHLVPASTMNFAVPRSSAHRRLAVELALFITNDENQLKFCRSVPLLPSTRKAAADPALVADSGFPLEDQARRISVEQLSRARDLNLGLKDWPRLGRILEEQVEAAVYGRKQPQQALDEAAKRWNEILSRQSRAQKP